MVTSTVNSFQFSHVQKEDKIHISTLLYSLYDNVSKTPNIVAWQIMFKGVLTFLTSTIKFSLVTLHGK